jgi:hypothetical protein
MWLVLLLAALPGWAQSIGAAVNESGVEVTYHVKTTGNNANSGLTADLAVRTLATAVDKAKYGPLSQGKKTKIVVYPGTHTENIWAVDWPGQGRGTVLIIEGTAPSQVTLKASGGPILSIQNKDNLVIRNLVFVGGAANGSLWGGRWSPFPAVREKQWLVSDCVFKESATDGARLQGLDNLTVQNCSFTNNQGAGLGFIGRYSKFVNLTLTGNGAPDDTPGLMFGGSHLVFDNITASDNRGAGIRHDWVGEDITITNSKFERNGLQGMRFEICLGPLLIKNCTVANNKKEAGLLLITVHNTTLDGCRFVDNAEAQVLIHPMNQRTTGDMEQADWEDKKAITLVKNTKVTNSIFCVTQAGSTAKIFKRLDETSYTEYIKWFQTEYQGSNNKFTAPNNGAAAFDVSVGYFANQRTYADLARWQKDTGEDANSTFSATCAGATALPTTAAAELAGFSVYPNPARDQLTLELPAGGEAAQLRVVDAAGRLVLRQAVPAGVRRHTLGLPTALAPGLYLLRLDQGSRHLSQRFARE